MTTINTQEDLLRALSENAEWRAAMRVQIVGDELMNMPPAFYAFMEKVSGFITEQMQFNADQMQFNADQKQFNAEIKEFVAEQKQFNAEMRQFVADQVDSSTRLELRMDNMARDVNELKDGFSTLSRRVDHLSTSFDRLRDDVGQVKGYYARNWAEKFAESIALNMGLEYIRTLPPAELTRMVMTAAAGRPFNNDQRSFQTADMIIEATDGNTPSYIAVEVSFTADTRDTNRALRNASMLTEYTGRPAQAAIVSVRNDHSISWQIESGAVYRHQIEERDIDPNRRRRSDS